jgi:putative peptidoglycan lipid II flippase
MLPDGGGKHKMRRGTEGEGQVLRALGSISGATLISRVLGFARDMVVALVFGAGGVTDAFFVAYRIPNMLRRLLGEGALSAAVIPVVTDYAASPDRAELVRMLRAVLGAIALVASGMALVGILAAPWLVRVMAPGFTREPGQADLTSLLARIMFPYLVLVALSAVAMGVLNAHGRFFASALGSAVQNVGIIACIVVLTSHVEPSIAALAIGVVVGGLGQLAVQVPDLRRHRCLVAPSLDLAHPAVARVGLLLLPAVVGLASVQINVFVNTLLASLLPPGSISYLHYADRVMELPLGVFGIALASASLPTMARQASAGNPRALAETLGFALRLAVFIAIPAALGLAILRTPIARVLFERGRFSAADTAGTAEALLWFALGLVGMSGSRIAAQTFYALQRPGVAVRMGVVAMLVNVTAAIVLMRPLRHAGLAAAASLAAYVNLAGLMWAARRRLGPVGIRALCATVARTALACVPLGAVCGGSLWLWPSAPASAVDGAWLAMTIALASAAFLAAARWLRSPELASLARALLRGAPD